MSAQTIGKLCRAIDRAHASGNTRELERLQELYRDSGALVDRLSPEPPQLVDRSEAADPRLRAELHVRQRELARIAAEDRERTVTTEAKSPSRVTASNSARSRRPPPPVMGAPSGPTWQLPRPTASLDPADHDVQSTARHEAGHAAAAHLLGWEVTEVELRAEGGGSCAVRAPRDLDRSLRHRQYAVMCLAAGAHVGWRRFAGEIGRASCRERVSYHV